MVNLDNLFFIIKEKGLSASKVSDDTGISTGNISDWKKGRSMPTAAKLDILANYLDCSVDYLLGRTDNPEVTYNNHALSGDGSVAVAGGNANITISNQQKEDTELLNLIKSLPLKKRVKIISMIYEELEEETK